MIWESVKRWTLWGAIGAGAAALATKLFDVLVAMLGPEQALRIVSLLTEATIGVVLAVAAIGVGWTTTYFFRTQFLEPDPKHGWKPHARRLGRCSFIWTTLVFFVALGLRYLVGPLAALLEAWDGLTYPARFAALAAMAETTLYLLIATLVVGGLSVVAYDLVVKRAWPRLLRYFFPTKFVQTPDGVEERPVDQPSDPETERTLLGGADPETTTPSAEAKPGEEPPR